MRVGLYPLQLDLDKHILRVTTDLRFQVGFQQMRTIQPTHLPKTIYDVALAATVNAGSLGSLLVSDANPETMLILVADPLRKAVEPLEQLETTKGLNVITVKLSEVQGTKEGLKAFLQKFYDSHNAKSTYFLFVGNSHDLPPFLEDVETINPPAASDYRFAQLSGDSPIPGVLYGRVVANNEEEVRMQIKRWTDYENMPASNSWYGQGSVIASNEGRDGGPPDVGYARLVEESMKKHGFTHVDRFYQSEETATAAGISSALLNGRSWLNYFGHGFGTAWGNTNDTFDVNAIGNLSNSRLPVVIDVACANGDYARIPTPFGKAWITHEHQGVPSGAIAYYGATVSISWHPPAIMATGIGRAQYEKALPTLGASVLAGQLYLVEQKSIGKDVIDNLKWYTLFGDPSLKIKMNTSSTTGW